MFEPIPEMESNDEMRFYIVVDDKTTWPQVEYAIVVDSDIDALNALLTRETNVMDVLLVCCDRADLASDVLDGLEQKFRISLFFATKTIPEEILHDSIAELCWASYHSHNFDILDADCLLSGCSPIWSLNETVIAAGVKSNSSPRAAILMLHHLRIPNEQRVKEYIAQVENSLGEGCVSLVSYSDGRSADTCNYSLLAAW